MAINKKFVVLIVVACFCFCIHACPLKICKFDTIYQLGDSISDTGNFVREVPFVAFAKLPYGQDFVNKTPTGRCSNGRLMIDYIATAAGLPFLEPYKKTDGDFTHGVNFAVAGSTALSSGPMMGSLDVQLGWMSSFFNSTCHLDHKVCAKKLEHALFMVGEIGGNDYNFAISQGKTTKDELRSLVQAVVNTIMNGVRQVVSFGATKVVVPGNFPIGCIPFNKRAFATNDSSAYDASKCLIQLNELAKYQNAELQRGIQKMVEEEKPNAIILYADYYNAYQFLLNFSKSNGFEIEKACCGFGGSYNLDVSCGAANSQVCKNPEKYISWDGMHLTQEAYKIMAAWLVDHLIPNLHCN